MATRSSRKRHYRSPAKKTTAGGKRAKRAQSKNGKSTPAKKTGARAIWKGTIILGTSAVAVKLYSAVSDKSIHFRLLDAKRNELVKQQMIDPDAGDVVPSAEVGSAYETKAGELVLLDDEELEKTEPRDSREIEILRFVDPAQVSQPWYDRPYFLGPDGDSASEYFALARAMANQNVEGIARWVMRKKDYVGALKVEGDYLVLITMRHAGEVVPATALPAPGGRDIDKREIDMARQLVATMRNDGKFDISQYKDTYRERVLELVRAKAAGKIIKFPRAPKRTETTELADVLQKSIASVKKGRKSA
jgi:DNA end-binding protein Ku